MTISFELRDDFERRLAEAAERLNVSVQELAAAAVRDLLMQPGPDLDAAVSRVLEKNRELYRRRA